MVCNICGRGTLEAPISVSDWFGRSVVHQYLRCNYCGAWRLKEVAPITDFEKSSQNFARKTASLPAEIAARLNYIMMRYYFRTIVKMASITYKGDFLDVGCGRGQFVQFAEAEGWQACGVEPQSDKYQVAKSRVKGMIHNDLVENIDFEDRRFDIVILWHVMEHIYNLHSLITTISGLLKIGGRIIVAVPNIESLQAKVFGVKWFHLGAPAHIYQFNERSQRALFAGHGLKTTKTRHFDVVLNFSGWFVSFYNFLGFSPNYVWHIVQTPHIVKHCSFIKIFGAVLISPIVASLSATGMLVEGLFRKGGCSVTAFEIAD